QQFSSSSSIKSGRWRRALSLCRPSSALVLEVRKASRWAPCHRPNSTSPAGRCTEDTCPL
ncbi:hypothetical protein M9458_021276, partial [Cirrhinus mrigala]